MHSFLLRFNNLADADAILAASKYATIEARGEEPITVSIPVEGTIGGQGVAPEQSFTFLASTVKGLTLPFNTNRSVPYAWAGLTGNRQVGFVLNSITPFVSGDRENWLRLAVTVTQTGKSYTYEVPDNGGTRIAPADGVEIWDWPGHNGIPLVNKEAVYAKDGTLISAVERAPGWFMVMRLQGAALEADLTGVDGDIWTRSVLAKGFKDNGTLQTYSRTPSQTDWGQSYTVSMYRRAIGGKVVDMIDASTLPVQITAQHGVLQGLSK